MITWHFNIIFHPLGYIHRDTGEEHGKYYNGLHREYRVYIGVIFVHASLCGIFGMFDPLLVTQ